MLKNFLLSTVVLGCCGALTAQERGTQFDVTASLLLGHQSLKKATHNDQAYGLSTGVKFLLPKVDLPIKLGLAAYDMPGKDFGSIKSSLKLTQFYTDFYLTSKLPNWAVKFGLSANKYKVTNTGTETWAEDPMNPDGAWAPQYAWAVTQDKGLKIGYRLGVDYAMSRHWGAELLFQLTELSGGEAKTTSETVTDPWTGQPTVVVKQWPNYGAVNPSWLQLGVRYTF